MKELWIKKTIYRRYLVEDNEVEEVKEILKDNNEHSIETIGDIYDKNKQMEYDGEEIILPIEYTITSV